MDTERIPGDLSEAEIERITAQHFKAIRRYGYEHASRLTYVRARRCQLRGGAGLVLEALSERPQTVSELATALELRPMQVHGVIGWLTHKGRVQVRYRVRSRSGQQVAVYGVVE